MIFWDFLFGILPHSLFIFITCIERRVLLVVLAELAVDEPLSEGQNSSEILQHGLVEGVELCTFQAVYWLKIASLKRIVL